MLGMALTLTGISGDTQWTRTVPGEKSPVWKKYNIKEGDIIVYSVPRMIREYYSYPPVVSHRVIKINKDVNLLSFRTKGDNTGEDPFSVQASNVLGIVGDQVPYLGFPLLFLQGPCGP